MTFSITTLRKKGLLATFSIMTLSIITLSMTIPSIMTLSHYDVCRSAECRNLFFVMLNVIMPSIVLLNVIMLSVIMRNVVMLSVVAPWKKLSSTTVYYIKARVTLVKSFTTVVDEVHFEVTNCQSKCCQWKAASSWERNKFRTLKRILIIFLRKT